MHELSIAASVVDAAAERAAGRHVVRVRLQVGRLSGVMPSALRSSFDIVAEGTPVEGATLEIDETPGRGFCRVCATDLLLSDLVLLCDCGSADVQLVAGTELLISSMEVA